MSTEEGYFPQGAASRNWTIRKAQDAPISPKGCPHPVGNGEMSPSWLREVRWRAREEAVAAAMGPKRREPMASGARQRESARLLPNRRLSSFEGMNSFLTKSIR
jgi:hypothetical protein